jgi:PAS domain S-box-containing protein
MSHEPSSPFPPMPPIGSFGLRSRMLIAFCLPMAVTLLLVGMVNTFGIPFTAYRGSYDLERDQVLRSLSLVADLKKERFELWLTERKDDVKNVCRDHSLVTAIVRLREQMSHESPTRKPGDLLSNELQHETTYPDALHELQFASNSYPAFVKMQVADAKTGSVIVTTKETELGANVFDKKFFSTALTGGYDESVEVAKDAADAKPYLIISQVLKIPPSGNGEEAARIAVVSGYVDTEEFLKPMLYTGEGLGQTGDIVLVNQDGFILMSLKFPLQDGTSADVLEFRDSAKPAVLASQGKEGIVAAADYRGVPVLAAYRHLRVAPDRGWGMVVKRDQEEVFGPVWRQIGRSSLVGILGLVTAVLMVILAANRISRPILRLCSTVQEVEAGNLSARSPTGGPIEVGILANAFNSMIARIQNWQQDLEEQVKARTVELKRSNEDLSAEIGERKRAEQSVLKISRALKTLSDCNQVVIRAENESALMTEICRTLVEVGGYAMAWVGFVQGDGDRFVQPVAKYGFEEGYLDKVRVALAEGEFSGETTGMCIRTLAPAVDRQTTAGAEDVPWRNEAAKRGYLSTIALPLTENGKCFGALTIYASQADAFDETEIELLSELAADLSFGIRAVRTKGRLQESEERFRLLVELSPDGILVHCYRNIILANRGAAKILGASNPEELVGKAIKDLVHPDYWQIVEARVAEMVSSGRPQPIIDEKFIRLDGTEIDVEVAAVPVIQEGKPLVQAIFRDVSARKRAQAVQRRLAAAVEQAAEAIVITDPQGHVQYVNPAFERMTGYSRAEVIDGKSSLFQSDEYQGPEYADLSNTLLKGGTWAGRVIKKRKDGSKYEEDITISPVRDASGRIVNYVAVKRDVTREALLEKQLLQAQKMEAIGTLAGGVAHDFNNLLQVIVGYSELLFLNEGLDSHVKDDLNRINRAARNGADLVNRLMTFSRKTESKPRPLNLNRQIDEVREFLYRTVPKMIDIELILDSNLAPINADPTQIEQILMNLAINARDAMPQGGKLVIGTENAILDEDYCNTHLEIAPGHYALLTVTDSGQGMRKETLEHIFEPFYTTKGPGEGTGLGLAMVYGIVKEHGGHIECYSEPEVGTAFKIYFPALGSGSEFEKASAKHMPPGGSETILLVDDEEWIRDLGVRILSRSGYKVLTAINGKEGLDAYSTGRKDISLVILDLVMPEMSGKQCLEEILKIDPDARVLIASGYSARGSSSDALAEGAKGFVNKPFDLRQLLAKVRAVLDAV